MANRHDPFIREAVLKSLYAAGIAGRTWGEISDEIGAHHGVTSGRLSLLHKSGHIARLSAKRGGSKVYVDKEFVAGRKTEPYGRSRQCPNCGVTV